jgi:hypothetical protein
LDLIRLGAHDFVKPEIKIRSPKPEKPRKLFQQAAMEFFN